MSFFDDASLAFLPSGAAGKDGKAYSIKPTDGTGDFTFSRGSNLAATRVGADGLIEKGRENLLTYSNEFDTNWVNSNVTTPITTGHAGYDGSTNAWLLNSTTTSSSSILRSINLSGVETISFFAKEGTTNWICVFGGVSNSTAWFNVSESAPALGTLQSEVIDASITPVTGAAGWFRCSVTYNISSTGFRIYLSSGDGSFNSAIGDNIYVQDAQLEQGLAATDYIESGATTGKAGLLEDEPRFDYSGGTTCPSLLLEGSRTNLVPFSEYYGDLFLQRATLTSNYGISPEGVQNAAAIFNTTDNGRHNLYGAYFAVTSGTSYVNSVFAKAGTITKMKLRMFSGGGTDIGFNDGDFDLTNGTATGTGAGIESYGNGWYRCYVVDSPTSSVSNARFNVELLDANGSISYVGSVTDYIEVFGSQVEAGSYPTSYIPNHSGTGSVTRGLDDCSVTGVSDLIGQTEGTVFLEFLKDNSDIGVISINDGSSNNRVYLGYNGANFIGQVRSGGGAAQAAFSSPLDVGEVYKCAIAYKLNDFVLYINGVQISTDTSGIVPVGMDSFSFYASTSADAPMVSPVSQALLFKERLSNADLETLTTL